MRPYDAQLGTVFYFDDEISAFAIRDDSADNHLHLCVILMPAVFEIQAERIHSRKKQRLKHLGEAFGGPILATIFARRLRCMTFRHQFRVAADGSTARLRHAPSLT